MSLIMVQMSRLPVRRQPVTSADGTKLAVTVTGDGPPLVVCPGSLATARDWQMVARALAPRMTTYALDRRGHGDSGDDPAYSLDHDLGRFATVPVPALLLLGELSPPWLIAASRRLAQFLPDVTVAELPGQAHDAHVFAPATVADRIARFALGDVPQA
jgi:pimeloyl-ACP methyl ester carboxylesterase